MLKDKLVTLGNTVGKYRIEARIAEGGMGVFWRALDTKLDRIVGLKTLHAEFSVEPSLRDRFVNEARALARLNHPNICVLHDFFESSEQLYIVMEFIQGETLADLVKHRGAFPKSEIVPIFRQILLALDYAHNHGVIHRDIKPSNIMVTEQGMVKVMDFGIAKMVEAPVQLTRTGRKVGSLLFMSPEQIREQPVDQRSDVYSLGVTLYQVCTGRVPFDATSEYDAMRSHLESTPEPPSSLNPEISKDLEYVILRAMSKRPEDRFQTALEMRNALGTSELMTTGDRVIIPSGEKTRVDGIELPSLISKPSVPAPTQKKRTGLILGVAGAVVLALAGTYFALRSGDSAKPAATQPPAVASAPTTHVEPAVNEPAPAPASVEVGAATNAAMTEQPQDSLLAQPPATPPVTTASTQQSLQSTDRKVSPAVAVPVVESVTDRPAETVAKPAAPETKAAESKSASTPSKKSSQPRAHTADAAPLETPAAPKAPVILAKYNVAVEVKPAGTYQIDRSGFGRAAGKVEEGRHRLEAMTAGLPIYSQPFFLRGDTTISVDLEAVFDRAIPGDLRVSAKSSQGDFPACQIKVNGADAGMLPGLRLPLKAGLYEVELMPPGGLQVDSLQFEGTMFPGARARIDVPPRSRSFARYYLSLKK